MVSIIGCTGDWFGGWDGLVPGEVNRFISEDLESGRMVDVIESDEPGYGLPLAGNLLQWQKSGFHHF